MAIAIVCDSTADLPWEIIKNTEFMLSPRRSILVKKNIGMGLIFPQNFIKMQASGILPTTSQLPGNLLSLTTAF